jgi:Tol biopolymer transport system component
LDSRHPTRNEDPLTFHPALDLGPIWSPSGKEIALTSTRNGNTDLFVKAADGSGQVVYLVALPLLEFVTDWSKDGKHLLYDRQDSETHADIWYLTQKADGDGFDAAPFLATKFSERSAKLSPDGRHVAYVSNESGENQVYVRPFPEGGSKWQISHTVGTQPRWRRDGRELFFIEGSTLIAVPVSLTSSFSAGTPTKLFQSPGLGEGAVPQYDVSADGQRFVTRESVGGIPTIHVVENWFTEFTDEQGGAQ